MKNLCLVSKGSPNQIQLLCSDIIKLIDGVPESKFDLKDTIHEIRELMEINECGGTFYFEFKRNGTSLWMTTINGPSIKLGIYDAEPMQYFTENAEKSCGAELLFTPEFETGNLLIFKNTISKMLKNEKPKDRVFAFFAEDGLISLRTYLIPEKKAEIEEAKNIKELGPRITMRIERILEGAFCGKLIFKEEKVFSTKKIEENLEEKIEDSEDTDEEEEEEIVEVEKQAKNKRKTEKLDKRESAKTSKKNKK